MIIAIILMFKGIIMEMQLIFYLQSVLIYLQQLINSIFEVEVRYSAFIMFLMEK